MVLGLLVLTVLLGGDGGASDGAEARHPARGTAPQARGPAEAPSAAGAGGFDRLAGYQTVRWGASLAEVKRAFPDVGPASGSCRAGPVGGYPAITCFYFAADRLARVLVSFEVLDTGGHVEAYEALSGVLVAKYGPSYASERVVPPSAQGLAPQTALWLGKLVYRTMWSREDGIAELTLYKGDTKPVLMLSYESRELGRALQEQQDAANQAKLSQGI
jgi:hypothetical protein